KPFVVPVTLAILIGLFSIQRHGTASVGVLFGPVVCLWFAVLALLGAMQIARDPAVLAALNPAYAFGFLTGNPLAAFLALGALLPLVVLATCATVIASQAVISGAFSLTRQAIQMGYCPRLTITHTSDRQIGQIYVPFINWTLMCAVMLLVVGFQSSSNLAAAY